MKKIIYFLSFYFCILTFQYSIAQNVGVGTNNPQAALDVSSTTNGFLPPRMTFAQRAAIVNPATGLIVWCTDCGSGGELSVFNGTEWRAGNFSNTSSVGTIPLAPTGLNVTVSSPLLYAGLSWTDVSTNEVGYKIQRKTGGGVFTQIGQVGTDVSTYNDSSIGQSSTYTYRVYAYNNAGNSAQYSNEFPITTYALPTITTNNTTLITISGITSGGNISNNGGTNVTARGVCWSTAVNPTIALTTKTVDGAGTGSFTSSITGLTPNTTYHVRAYATNSIGTSYGGDSVFTTLPILLPTVTTNTITAITNTTATGGGNVTFDGNTSVTARGVCWSTSANPTIDLATKTIDGAGTGTFTSSMTGLTANTTYYVRAYATNSLGTVYATQQTFTTTNTTFVNLPNVTIGTQIWTTQNLNVSRYRNGDPIPQVTDATQWANLTTGAWCWYNNDSATYAATYGRLYNWYAVNDPRGLAPQGWHVPTDREWDVMTKYLDPTVDTTCQCSSGTTICTQLKNTTGWNSSGNGTNSSGFAGLPGGGRYASGSFDSIGGYGVWWSSTEDYTTYAWRRTLYYYGAGVNRYYDYEAGGFSVRLVRD